MLAGHVRGMPDVHEYLHGVLPHVIEHFAALSVQLTVQSPAGQAIVHFVVPSHVSVEPAPRSTLQLEPPLHVMLLSTPASRLQLAPPPHVDVQPLVHVCVQVDEPAHDVLQPEVQLTTHVLFVLQS